MPENKAYLPEGLRHCDTYTLEELQSACENHTILEAIPLRCDPQHHLHFQLGSVSAILPRQEVIAPWISGADRNISAISRVGKSTCFTVNSLFSDAKGAPQALLSRREAQETAISWFQGHLHSGSVIAGRVVRTESYGAFVDIGCGIIALLPVERVSISRIEHPGERFLTGQKILAVILHIHQQHHRITLTHRELLGTWMENAASFQPGETVRGTVRSIKPYGAFVELSPNLSGLAEPSAEISVGDSVSVYIKSIRSDSMKIKLQIVEKLPRHPSPEPLRYQITDGSLSRWVYSPPDCTKEPIYTDFTAYGS